MYFANFNFLYLKDHSSNIINNNNIFLKTLSLSIIFSGIIYFAYKNFPQIFPEIAIRTIPQRFFLIHSIVGYPIIVSISYFFLKKFFYYQKISKDYSLMLFLVIILLHLLQQYESLKFRYQNIEIIKKIKFLIKYFGKKLIILN